MPVLVHSVGEPALPPLTMPDRFRHEVCYFMTPPDAEGVPSLAAGEYWVSLAETRRVLDEGVVRIVSPLDVDCHAEVEISEDQERWLNWLLEHQIEHIRLQSVARL